ncbi:deoxyribonuclease IV [Candidatus Uhrbacteria bacterium]|nr:deoxyribonuclease IV [Candidatus Uhrbacteria bacterium]
MPLLGAHVSASGGLYRAAEEAAALKLDSFQFFTRPPQTGRAPEISELEAEKFLSSCGKHGLKTWHVHAPYVINLASPEGRIRGNSIRLLREELERADRLKSRSVIAHVGSAAGNDRETGMGMVIDGIRDILRGYGGNALFAVETTAGSGHTLCSSFGEIAMILREIDSQKLAVCLDTAHVFAAGYGLETQEEASKTLGEFDGTVGIKNLIAVHLNDSRVGRGSRRDRHEHLGYGKIGSEGLFSLLNHRSLKDVDFIMETPNDARRKEDIATARRWLSGEMFFPIKKT